jgi:anti-sigma-K factor RskA
MADESTLEPELAEIEAMLRSLTADDLVVDAPPDDVWAAIASELADELRSTDDVAPASNVVTAPFGRRWAAPLLAAAAALVVVVAGVAVFSGGTNTVAEAELAFDPTAFDPAGATAAAEAALIDDDGRQIIRIDDESLPFDAEADAALELWLIQADADGNVVDLVSLGDIAPDGSRSFTVPAGYDPDVYSVVDISIEPRDGDETHSGRSILRGALSA